MWDIRGGTALAGCRAPVRSGSGSGRQRTLQALCDLEFGFACVVHTWRLGSGSRQRLESGNRLTRVIPAGGLAGRLLP